MDDTPLNFLTESVFKGVCVPVGHCTQAEFFSENGVETFVGEVIAFDLNSWLSTISCVYNSGNSAAAFFKQSRLFNLIGEANQKETLSLLERVTRVHNLLHHIDNQLGLRPHILTLV